jgi:hypothetical protein
MRNIIAIFLIFLISVSFLLAQDIEPEEQFVFTCPFTSNTYTVSSDIYQQKGFLLGWHWGLGQRMSEALEIYPYLPIPLLAYLSDFLREE